MLLGLPVELLPELVVVSALVLCEVELVLEDDNVAMLIVLLRFMTVPVPAAPVAPLATAPVPGRRVVIETVALPAEVVVVTDVVSALLLLLLPLLGTGTGTMGVMPDEADEDMEDDEAEDKEADVDVEVAMTAG